jgi:drug/metabolite transporter (DMT)-like permease
VALAFAAVAATTTSLRMPAKLLLATGFVGVFDTSANVAFAAASTEGAIGIVAVLGALYPLVTILLARVVLGERLSPSRRAGGTLALAGAALVAVG